jgi:hypothetical protein
LCRSGFEALFRKHLGIKGRTKHKDKPNPFQVGAYGAHRISLRGSSDTIGTTVELELTESGAEVLPHIKFFAADDSEHIIVIREEMREPAQLRAAFDALGIKRAKRAFVCGPVEKVEVLKHLLTGLKIDETGDWTIQQNLTFRDNLITISVTEKYFRCLAKIGFHYFLHRFPEFTGSEECFGPIRDFIMIDGDLSRCNEFVSIISPDAVANMLRTYKKNVWGHALTAHIHYLSFSAVVQTFGSAENLALAYCVKLGPNPSRIITPRRYAGSFFAITPKDRRKIYDGSLVEAPPLARYYDKHLSCTFRVC